MNEKFTPRLRLASFSIAVGVFAAGIAHATPASQPPASPATAVVQSKAIPQSIFIIPTDPKNGRDPFFPKSERFAGTTTTKAKTVSDPDSTALTLQGISGSADRRLAIINGRTLAEGEEADILIGANRIHFRCVEIKAQAAVIEMGSARRELHLRSGS